MPTPNFVIIMTDDQGYQDLGCYGSPDIATPEIDRMAREGMRFTDFYAAAPICSPSRAALLTGCYPPRTGVTRVLFPKDDIGLSHDYATIAEVLKKQGYATACIGKWHLGHKPEFLPTRRGFDYYFGVPYSNDMTIDPEAKLADDIVLREGKTLEDIRAGESPKTDAVLMRDEEVIEFPADQSTLTQRYTREAIDFITINQAKPFFLYLPHTMPHVPLAASPGFRGKSRRGLYGDAIEEIDWSTGQILKTLKELKLDTNTLVLFTSDNGPWLTLKDRDQAGTALPLRDGKFTTYEGGMREPCVAWWPGTIPEGVECGELASTIDLLPTLANLAGAELPQGQPMDGKDIVPLLKANPGAKSPHDAFCYFKMGYAEAVRRGKWKLRHAADGEPELYDLHEDIGETTNLAATMPDLVSELESARLKFQEEIGQA
jgi:arylsulfatase A